MEEQLKTIIDDVNEYIDLLNKGMMPKVQAFYNKSQKSNRHMQELQIQVGLFNKDIGKVYMTIVEGVLCETPATELTEIKNQIHLMMAKVMRYGLSYYVKRVKPFPEELI